MPQSIGTDSDSTSMNVPAVFSTYKSKLGEEIENSVQMSESSQTNCATTACKLHSTSCL